MNTFITRMADQPFAQRKISVPLIAQRKISVPLTPDILTTIENQTQASKDDVGKMYEKVLAKYPIGEITEDGLNLILKTCFPSQNVDDLHTHIFRMYDTNEDGVIDFHESLTAITIMGAGTLEEKLEQIFRLYDINNDGAISREEWERIFKILSNWKENRRWKNKEVKERNEVKLKTMQVGTELIEPTTSELAFKQMDKDKDSKITKEEFIQACQSREWIRYVMTSTIKDILGGLNDSITNV